ncbi:MAG TPA: sugar ABC transporter ATP-binding protein [Fibrobacteria bacterium]|nr:sugar ABC transporter ATP-binding protein [Fibrobacteria bacterium]
MSLLTARGLTMSYPGVRALGGVDFELRAGEIHALCGANGAGKSTLIKILCGVIPHGRHGGIVTLAGNECRFAGPADARRAGIRVIHQELALCPDLDVTENVFLGEEFLRGPILDRDRMESETRAALDRLGLSDVPARARVGALPVGLQQMVEIARALRSTSGDRHGAKILILDEPTSALSAREATRLEEVLLRLRADGYGLLYISHRLDEVFRLADRVTVLRDGESVGEAARGAYDAARVVAMMAGTTWGDGLNGQGGHDGRSGQDGPGPSSRSSIVSNIVHPPTSFPPSATLLSVKNWTVPSPANPDRNVVDDVSFDLRAGEILGFAGLMGAGRTELVESLCGLFPARGRGEIVVDGKPYTPRDAGHALRHGLALVGEDRRARGLFPGASVRANITMSSLRDFCAVGWLLREAPERGAARTQVDALRVKTPDTEFRVEGLSGGNQQKALLGRALLTRPKILILDEPTRGVDPAAKEEIYALIRKLAGEGLGVLLISSETEEVLKLAHRVIVLRAGRAAAERQAEKLTTETVLALAA